jgi:hypothetical protein
VGLVATEIGEGGGGGAYVAIFSVSSILSCSSLATRALSCSSSVFCTTSAAFTCACASRADCLSCSSIDALVSFALLVVCGVRCDGQRG